MFSRSIFSLFDKWAEKKDRKPLVLRGARQVGKTTAVDLWAKQFDHYLYFNLDLSDDRKLFESNLEFDKLIESIFFQKNVVRDKGKTLLFIDEIQNSPGAVELLRYFYEKSKNLYVIAAGSLLESLIDRRISFPVGRVEYMIMRPLSFMEYLKAADEERALEELSNIPVKDYAHNRLMELFNRYTLIGGMPEVVRVYLESGDLTYLKTVFDSLIVAYLDDVEKYASNRNQAEVIRHIIMNAFYEAGNRITFQGFGKSNYRSREMGEAFTILEKAMLLALIYPTTALQVPAIPDRRKSPRLQILDTGLVTHFAGLQGELISAPDIDRVFRGRIAEHIVGQEILGADPSPLHGLHFWVREKKQSTAEMDFVFSHSRGIIPIEVKSGSVGRLRSLHQFMDLVDHPFAIRLYGHQLKMDSIKTLSGKPFHLLNLPYYLAGKLDIYLDWFIQKVD